MSEPIHELVVGTGAGDVDIVATSADHITVRQTTHWITDEPSPKKSVSDGVLTLADADDCGGWTLLRCETDYRIDVPRDLVVSINADAGDVHVTGLVGALTMESDAGNVKGSELGASNVKASTDAGDVKLAFSVVPQLGRSRDRTPATSRSSCRAMSTRSLWTRGSRRHLG